MPETSFSIVCPTYQGERKLNPLVACLEANFDDIESLREIIFIIDNSHDNSEKVLKTFQESYPHIQIRVHVNPMNVGPAQSRNIGAEIATGSILLFLDDDCRPEPSWLRNVVASWKSAPAHIEGIGSLIVPSELESFNGQYCSVFSPIKPWPLTSRSANLPQRIRNYYQTLNPVSAGTSYFSGASMSFRRSTFLKLEGFSPNLRISEDIELCQRFRAKFGDDCLAVVDSYVMPHDFSTKFSNSLLRAYKYGLGSGRNFLLGETSPSFNPGPLLILLSSVATSLALELCEITDTDLVGLVVSMFILFCSIYPVLVTLKIPGTRTEYFKRIKLGYAFLLCELANLVGFLSAIRYLKFFSKRLV